MWPGEREGLCEAGGWSASVVVNTVSLKFLLLSELLKVWLAQGPQRMLKRQVQMLRKICDKFSLKARKIQGLTTLLRDERSVRMVKAAPEMDKRAKLGPTPTCHLFIIQLHPPTPLRHRLPLQSSCQHEKKKMQHFSRTAHHLFLMYWSRICTAGRNIMMKGLS